MKKLTLILFILSILATVALAQVDTVGNGDVTEETYPAYYTWLSGALNVLLGIIVAFREKSSATARRGMKLLDNVISLWESGSLNERSIASVVTDAKAIKKGETPPSVQ